MITLTTPILEDQAHREISVSAKDTLINVSKIKDEKYLFCAHDKESNSFSHNVSHFCKCGLP